MQVIDTYSPVGWNSPAYFNNYMEAKKGMKFVVDAAHARGMIFRTVPNSVLRLAQLNEAVLTQRKDAPLPAGADEQAKKKFIRSQQRDATALMVRRMFKRIVSNNDQAARLIEDVDTNGFYDGVASKLAYKKLQLSDIQNLSAKETARYAAAARTWKTTPYTKVLTTNINLRSYNFNIGGAVGGAGNAPNPPLYDLTHYVGFEQRYLKDLIFPPGGLLRKDINLIIAFSLSIDGRAYIPVGFSIYGTCQSERESSRELPGGLYDTDVVHFLTRRPEDLNEAGINVGEALNAWAQTNNGLNHYYNQADPPADRGNNILNAAGVPLPWDTYNTGSKKISALQNKLYRGNVAEIYVIAAEDILNIDYQIQKDVAYNGAVGNDAAKEAAYAGVQAPQKTLTGYGTMMMAFTVCLIAAERESRKLGPADNQMKRWFPKYAGIVSELAPNTSAMTHAETAVRNNQNLPTNLNTQDRVAQLQARNDAKRGTQLLRNLSVRLGFTSQPVLIADAKSIVGKQTIPDFSASTIGNDDTFLFPYTALLPNPDQHHLGGELDYDSYVALYKPCQGPADIESDFIPLAKLLESLPKVLNAENNEAITDNFQRICPEGRGRGSVMCM